MKDVKDGAANGIAWRFSEVNIGTDNPSFRPFPSCLFVSKMGRSSSWATQNLSKSKFFPSCFTASNESFRSSTSSLDSSVKPFGVSQILCKPQRPHRNPVVWATEGMWKYIYILGGTFDVFLVLSFDFDFDFTIEYIYLFFRGTIMNQHS